MKNAFYTAPWDVIEESEEDRIMVNDDYNQGLLGEKKNTCEKRAGYEPNDGSSTRIDLKAGTVERFLRLSSRG